MLVLALAALSIITRELFSLASVWLPNGVLLGLFMLYPQFDRPINWLSAPAALLTADLISGLSLPVTMMLTAANISGVAAGIAFARMRPRWSELHDPRDAAHIVLVAVAAAAATSIVGGISATQYFSMSYGEGVYLWFTTELANYVIVLPVLAIYKRGEAWTELAQAPDRLGQVAALLTLIASLALLHFGGHVGAIAFPVPALILCAFQFRPGQAILISAMVCIWLLLAAPLDIVPLHVDLNEVAAAASLRLGIAMVAAAAFAVIVLQAAWQRTHAQLQRAVIHDPLTQLYNRAGFIDLASRMISRQPGDQFVTMLMIDIDHFKQINDTHGHAAGDTVLRAIATHLLQALRSDDVIGRVGGEEFAVALNPGRQGLIVAQRICSSVRQLPIAIGDVRLSVTISVGVATVRADTALGAALALADKALYRAKEMGRDRVVAH